MSRAGGPVFEEQCLHEIQELTARAERAEAANLGLAEKLTREKATAERAEAAAAQMRAALEKAWKFGWIDANARDMAKVALSSDAGKDWVSSEAHAAVVAERDALQRHKDGTVTVAESLLARAEKAEAERDEAVAQAAVMRDVLESCLDEAAPDPAFSDAVCALGERVGYGVLMRQGARLWRESLTALYGSSVGDGAFVAGPCRGTVKRALATDAGRALSEEVRALREVEQAASSWNLGTDGDNPIADALAKLDAIRAKAGAQ